MHTEILNTKNDNIERILKVKTLKKSIFQLGSIFLITFINITFYKSFVIISIT